MALLLPSVSEMTAVAELIVEHHFTPKPMCQVTVAMKCSMHRKEDIFLALLFHLPMVMGLSWAATDDISGYCQINVDERRREDFYFLFFPLSGGCGDLF